MEYFDGSGYFIGQFPPECVADCSHAGRCDDDVEFWRKKLDFAVPREKAIGYLREFGAWDTEELAAMSDDDMAEKVLWIACGDIQENGEWLGLVH